ncbi:MAG: tryptophan synthase subunit alpha [Desulfarculus sp.]|nr:MAG: tryptophan synthase subunit alpha [Desulfarculus sp.]
MSASIKEAFAAARGQGRCAFLPFVTGGYPDPELCLELMQTLDQAGADLIEVGVPFSDPLADGPVIQRSSQLALAAGATPGSVLELVARAAARVAAPLVLMTYVNPLLAMGTAEFAARAAGAGAAGVIVPDLPPEEAGPWLEAARGQDLDTVFLAAPTTPPERLARIAAVSRGFLYYVALVGVTGAELALDQGLLDGLQKAREVAGLPVAAGFGVATPAQARGLAAAADGVIVGSALMRQMLEAPQAKTGLAACQRLAQDLARSLGRA